MILYNYQINNELKMKTFESKKQKEEILSTNSKFEFNFIKSYLKIVIKIKIIIMIIKTKKN